MGLARLYSGVTGLGQVLINKLGVSGGPRADRVNAELDQLIAWAKDSPRVIRKFAPTTIPGNITTGLDTLDSYSLDTPNRLTTNLDFLRVRYGGAYANTEDNKQIRLSFGGQLVISFGAVVDLENGAWYVDLTFIRTSSTTVRVAGFDTHCQFRMADGAIVTSPSGYFSALRNSSLTVSDLSANATTLLLQGEGANTDDVTVNFIVYELYQQ